MKLSRSLRSTALFCHHCQKHARFLPIHFAHVESDVSRATLYNWMDRGWIHWLERPNGRRMICEESLHFRVPNPLTIGFPQKIRPRVSRTA
jgi:hypothetical protein